MGVFLSADIETTGLDPERCRIIEVAARLLAPGREIARYHSLVSTSLIHDHWEPVAKNMHESSGLIDEALNCEKEIEQVDDELIRLVDKHVPGGEPVYLMGNSVHFDRSFMRVHMPLVHGRLHYRQLDVTSVRLWFYLMSGEDPRIELSKPHRAEEDIDNTIKQATELWRGR
jgi:oligoribonuclease